MAKIISLPDGVEFDVGEGETLLMAALRAELPLAHACGGRAKCSTCRIWVLDGLGTCPARNKAERELAGQLGLPIDWRGPKAIFRGLTEADPSFADASSEAIGDQGLQVAPRESAEGVATP